MADTNVVTKAEVIVSKAVLLSIDGQISLPPSDDGSLPKSDDSLIAYARLVAFEVTLRDTRNLTFTALQSFSSALVAAHAAAALVMVAGPTDAQIKALGSAMDQLSTSIQQDQRFQFAMGLATSVATAVKSNAWS